MKSREEIEVQIQKLEKDYAHVLNRTDVTAFNNIIVSGMQAEVTGQLSQLYWVLEKKAPLYPWQQALFDRVGR